MSADLYDGAAVALGVVDAEGDKVLALNAGAVLVIDRSYEDIGLAVWKCGVICSRIL